jgi:hypothetical protein
MLLAFSWEEGVLALVGVVVGGAITAGVGYLAERQRRRSAREDEDRRAERARETEQRVARGTARALRSHFLQWQGVLDTAIAQNRWWADPEQPLSVPPLEDRKLVASQLSAEQWHEIEYAEFGIHRAIAKRAQAGDSRGLYDEDIELVARARDYVAGAIGALAELGREREPGP